MSYKTECPMCGGSNFYVTPHNGVSYCFNCGHVAKEHGKHSNPVQSPHVSVFRQMYTQLAEYYHSCLDTVARDYLHKRGITDDSINTYKLGFCPASSHVLYTHPLAYDAGIVRANKTPVLSDRIVFPYWLQREVCDLRGRTMVADAIRYLSLNHGAIERGANYAFNCTPVSELEIITEGEFKAIAANQLGYTARSLPGILSPRVHACIPGNKQVICFDSQRNHRYHVVNAIHKLAERLPDPYVATLPLRGKAKQDIDGYILEYGAESFHSVIRAAIPYDRWKALL